MTSKPYDQMRILHNMAIDSKCFDSISKIRWHENTDSEDSDWSVHNTNEWKWIDGSPYVTFDGELGPAIIIGERPGTIMLRRDKLWQQLEFLIMQPFTWEEYGSPMTDYEVYGATTNPAEALGIMAKLLVTDRAKNWYPLFNEPDFYGEDQ